jgi:hypothetical protein
MSYSRPPTTVKAGRALTQSPATTNPPGVLPVTLDTDIATTSKLGVVQVGSGLAITALGVLSATGGGNHNCCYMKVYLTSRDYTATDDDCYIGAVGDDREDNKLINVVEPVRNIEITLPKGIIGKVYTVKNQNTGNIKVQGTDKQQIDTSEFKTLGSQASITVVFDGTRWNIIN